MSKRRDILGLRARDKPTEVTPEVKPEKKKRGRRKKKNECK